MSIKKAPARAQGGRKSLAIIPVEVKEVPLAPEGLTGPVLAEWHAFWQSEYARIINWDRDHRALSRLFRMYALEAELEAVSTPVMLLGSSGQSVLNPALRQLAALRTEILALEKQFGMTTQSATGLGLSLGSLRKTFDERNREANAAQRKA